MEESGLYNTTINIPIETWAGDPVDFAATQDWATVMNSIDPNIHASPLYMEFAQTSGYMVANENPLPIYLYGWYADYPYPSDFLHGIYQETGYYGSAGGWNPQVLTAAGYQNEANEDALMNQYITDGQSTGNTTLALKYYDQAEVLGVNLTLITYTYQPNGFWFYVSTLHGMQYELNPLYGDTDIAAYIYLSK
jgi:ABC-type oligopeptide transport system substrate-binding subunit